MLIKVFVVILKAFAYTVLLRENTLLQEPGSCTEIIDRQVNMTGKLKFFMLLPVVLMLGKYSGIN